MNAEHCTSLEISKQIKVAGWKKEMEFWWVYRNKDYPYKLEYGHPVALSLESDIIPAPLATEILEELPYKINEHYLTITKDVENYYNVHYGSRILVTGIGLSNALAKLWLYLQKESKQ